MGLDEYIVTEYVKQNDFCNTLASNSLNTIRLQFCEGELVRAYHGFGCNGNVVDNVGSGNGILVFLDHKTEIFKDEGFMSQKGSYLFVDGNISHPDNGFKGIAGKVQQIVNAYPFLKWAGFDIGVTNEGFYMIEVNSLSSLTTVQQRIGFYTDPLIKRTFIK